MTTKQSYDHDFQPTVKCPHCGKVQHPCISGYGGKLSTRFKDCKNCGKPYTVLVLTKASTNMNLATFKIRDMQNQIKRLTTKLEERWNSLVSISEEQAKHVRFFQNPFCGRNN